MHLGSLQIEFDEGDFDFLDHLDDGMADPAFSSLYDGSAAYRKLQEGKRNLSAPPDEEGEEKVSKEGECALGMPA